MLMTMSVTGHFDAAHELPNYEGKCSNLHGHRWEYEVEISGDPSVVLGDDGMFLDFTDVKAIMEVFDHHYINELVKVPTAENIALRMVDELAELIRNEFFVADASHILITVTIWESPRSSITIVAYADEGDDNGKGNG